MIDILTGPAGSGKTARLLGMIDENVRAGRGNMLLIVPEQQSYAFERELARVCGARAVLYAEVVSFRSLARKVFAACGGLARARIDDGGRLLLMRLAAGAAGERLSVYGGCEARPELLERLAGAVRELKNAGARPERLLEAAASAPEPLKSKLGDLFHLLSAYDALLGGELSDPADDMALLAEKLRGGFLEGWRVYIDGFNGFTAGELSALDMIFQTADDTALTLCCAGFSAHAGGAFSHTEKTAGELARLLSSASLDWRETALSGSGAPRGSDLERLSRGLFDYAVPPSADPRDGSVRLMSAPGIYAECELAASEILRLAREEGKSYGGIAIAVRNMGMYAQTLPAVFRKWGLPLFLDRPDPASSRLPVRALLAALSICSGGRTDDLLRLAKTGLAGITPEEADLLENYIFVNGPPLSRCFSPFTAHPDGLGSAFDGESAARLAAIEEIRARLTAPLERLRSASGSARQLCAALYGYMTDIDLASGLERLASESEARGDRRSAGIIRALWDELCGALDQCALILGDSPADMRGFAPLFALLLSRRSAAAIPPSADCIQAGEAGRMRLLRPGTVFVLGAADGVFPPGAPEGGIFTSGERKFLLESAGIGLSPPDDEAALAEQLIAYQTFSAPRERLYISCPETGASGGGLEPSYLVGRAKTLLPGLTELSPDPEGLFRCAAPGPCAETAAPALSGEGGRVAASALAAVSRDPAAAELLERAVLAARPARGPLSDRAVISGLFGKPLSPSRVELFNTCRFAHFARSGLGLRPLRKPELGAADIGTFIHFILEHTAADAAAAGADWRNIDRAMLRESARRHAGEYAALYFGEERTPRMEFLLSRLCARAEALLMTMADEFALSLFKPEAFELQLEGEFAIGGGKLTLTGKLDRLDVWEDGGKRYIRVADYKTGDKKFEYTDVKNGLSLQLLFYLFAVTSREENAVPAGALYIPALGRPVKVAPGDGPEKVAAAAREAMKRTGVVLGEPRVLRAMEDAEKPRFIPAGGRDSSAVTRAQLDFLEKHLGAVLGEMKRELAAGAIECTPYTRAARDACEYCDYRALCRFDELSPGDRKRELETVGAKKFYGEEAENGGLDGKTEAGD